MHFSLGKNSMWLCVGCLSVGNSSVDVLVLRGKIYIEMHTIPGRTKARDWNRGCTQLRRLIDTTWFWILQLSATKDCSVAQNINFCKRLVRHCEMTELPSFRSKCIEQIHTRRSSMGHLQWAVTCEQSRMGISANALLTQALGKRKEASY